MTKDQVMTELEALGSEGTKKMFLKHGAKEPFFGVKVANMKKIVKKVKKDHQLSMDLFETSNGDAQYLAGLIADEEQISKKDLQSWVEKSNWQMVSEYTVPWIAAESHHGYDLALEWIESDNEKIASAGWATLSSLASIKDDSELDTNQYSILMDRVEKEIHEEKNRVKYTMNGFIIAVGSYIPELSEKAISIGERIGKVKVDMNGTACKVPLIPQYINKVVDKGRVGIKRKMARC
jgi:3-methyladenine DNA glycosylase AlkD